ncbi:hypothetical protein K8I28_02440 [bacterium]|nr:hypothetical protein [bacterium]
MPVSGYSQLHLDDSFPPGNSNTQPFIWSDQVADIKHVINTEDIRPVTLRFDADAWVVTPGHGQVTNLTMTYAGTEADLLEENCAVSDLTANPSNVTHHIGVPWFDEWEEGNAYFDTWVDDDL